VHDLRRSHLPSHRLIAIYRRHYRRSLASVGLLAASLAIINASSICSGLPGRHPPRDHRGR
jgi:hypothetical protein